MHRRGGSIVDARGRGRGDAGNSRSPRGAARALNLPDPRAAEARPLPRYGLSKLPTEQRAHRACSKTISAQGQPGE